MERANREATVRAQVDTLRACIEVGATLESLLPVVEAWLMENLKQR